MKLSAAGLKNIDWKQFGVNHGEKIALGLVSLTVVLIVFMGTRWSKFTEKEPNQLISEVEKQSQVLVSEPWPEAEQQTYTDKYDVNIVYDNTYSVVNADAFRYPIGHTMIWPLHRRQEPIQEPTWLAVQDLIQTPGRFILELPPEGQDPIMDGAEALAQQAAADAKGPMNRDDAIEQALKPKTTQQFGEDGMGGAGFDPMLQAPGLDPMANPGMNPMMMGEEGYAMSGPQINARGVRFIAVRGAFPFREQVEKVMKARHDPTLKNARHLVQFANFEIQRQSAKPGPNPWSDKDEDWKTLDQRVALELLAETINYAEDIVDPTNKHFVITSPLPARLVGSWSAYFVGHPKIQTLTERQLELRRLLDEQLVKLKQEASMVDPDGIGGFANAQRDMLGIQSEVMSDVTQKRALMSSMQQMMNPGGEESFQMPGDVSWMLSSATETPEYLLFRYFDFGAEPGVAYRYRVRLKLFNPNYNELPDNLAAENVGTGEFRQTPWSEPTPIPTGYNILQEDANFFVGDVLPAKARQEPKAKIDLYQWVSEIGTTANKFVEVQVGQFIGQLKGEVDENEEPKDMDLAVEVLRPYQSFKKEAVELMTDEVVVDLAAPPVTLRSSNKEFHADLKVKDLEPLAQVLVVNEYGELENYNPVTHAKQHASAKKYLKLEHEPWEDLKRAAELPPEGMMEGDPMMGMGVDVLIDAGGGGAGRGGAVGRGGAGRNGAAGRGGRSPRSANPYRRNRSIGGVGGAFDMP